MTISDIIKRREISEILHFTTNRGITGILASGAIKSRERLTKDDYLEYVYYYNCEHRSRDVAWHDYVNLSVTTVNRRLFGISKGRWHADMDGWWCILAFSPDVLSHDGVIFATTNNIYTGVLRNYGPSGLERLFAPKTKQWEQKSAIRTPEMPENQPTCKQAEVLYPEELSLRYLDRIYFSSNTHAAEIEGLFDLLDCDTYECKVEIRLF